MKGSPCCKTDNQLDYEDLDGLGVLDSEIDLTVANVQSDIFAMYRISTYGWRGITKEASRNHSYRNSCDRLDIHVTPIR